MPIKRHMRLIYKHLIFKIQNKYTKNGEIIKIDRYGCFRFNNNESRILQIKLI